MLQELEPLGQHGEITSFLQLSLNNYTISNTTCRSTLCHILRKKIPAVQRAACGVHPQQTGQFLLYVAIDAHILQNSLEVSSQTEIAKNKNERKMREASI